MTLSEANTLARAAVRYAREDFAGRIEFPRDRLGTVLEMEDGNQFEVYRETALRPPRESTTDEAVVLGFWLTVSGPDAGTGLRTLLTEPVANVATPFFAGLPGFRRKLWLAGEDPGEFLELYEWETEADAERFVRVMRGLLGPFGFAGSASFEVLDADSVDEYVASHLRGWHQTSRLGSIRARRPWVVPVGLVLGALGVGLAVAKRRHEN